jgi:DNA-binding CsgD family transcriptional regulator
MDFPTGQPLDPHHPGLADLLAEPFNRTVWELFRRQARAATLEEIAGLSNAPRERVAGSVARLHALGLVKPAFEPGTRRRTAFRITRERLVVVYNRDDHAQVRAAAEIRTHVANHGRGVLESARAHAALHADEATEVHRSMHLRHEEFIELRRRIQSVADFVESIEAKAGQRPHLCNYHMALEVRPLKELVLPTASLHVIDGGAHRSTESKAARPTSLSPTGRLRTKVLSAREREVGQLLADGRSCPEISSELSLSVNTVRTITKRLYQKLGVRRRAELVNWLRRPSV